MLERERLESKKISKTNAVTSIMGHELPADDVYIGPSDYVPWLTDRKWAHIRLEGQAFGDVPLNVEMKLEVWDSPNSAGIVIDAVRLLQARAQPRPRRPARRPELVPHEVAAEPAPRRRGARGDREVHRQVRAARASGRRRLGARSGLLLRDGGRVGRVCAPRGQRPLTSARPAHPPHPLAARRRAVASRLPRRAGGLGSERPWWWPSPCVLGGGAMPVTSLSMAADARPSTPVVGGERAGVGGRLHRSLLVRAGAATAARCPTPVACPSRDACPSCSGHAAHSGARGRPHAPREATAALLAALIAPCSRRPADGRQRVVACRRGRRRRAAGPARLPRRSSAFYRERLAGTRRQRRGRPPALPLHDQGATARRRRPRDPPFGEHLCAPRERSCACT